MQVIILTILTLLAHTSESTPVVVEGRTPDGGTYIAVSSSSDPESPNQQSYASVQTSGTSPQYYQTSGTSSKYHQPSDTSSKFYQPSGTSSKFYQPSGTSSKYYRSSDTSPQYYQTPGTSSKFHQPSGTSSKYYRPLDTSSQYYQSSDTSPQYYSTFSQVGSSGRSFNTSPSIFGLHEDPSNLLARLLALFGAGGVAANGHTKRAAAHSIFSYY